MTVGESMTAQLEDAAAQQLPDLLITKFGFRGQLAGTVVSLFFH